MKQMLNKIVLTINIVFLVLTIYFGWYAYELGIKYQVVTGVIHLVSLIALFVMCKRLRVKKYFVFIVTSFLTVLTLYIASMLYGYSTIYIANLMPSATPIIQAPFAALRIQRLISDMVIIIPISVCLSAVFIFLLHRKNILKKGIFSHLVIIILPIVSAGIKMFLQYGYSW